ncbi:class I SAM-dependent methyltransferase [Roseiconus lacunae]|uniref:Class I SAM-dependent methyltransferase n=1 Tax=Roseiconus lacunae TaxID=2605694 RepID=A0ABT7PMF9_9BACT|nr:class I SAM-dependent methyltransferase [Roseiconus lacunae]MDM4017341.1 class I SAM-dependent methyltransferase [Roseiconus lacunae]
MSAPQESDQSQSIRSAGDRTVQQYQDWMQINGASHLMRTARQSGITARLREKQHSLGELCEALSLNEDCAQLVLDGLVAIGYVEQYGDDYALARAGHLLCQYDEDLGDSRFESLLPKLKLTSSSNDGSTADTESFRNDLAATQWIHTSAAMQAAEVLDIGGEGMQGLRILDLGCGSAVWSCAMAHRDPESSVTAVDLAGPLESARSTAESIGLQSRLKTIEANPPEAELGEQEFDLAVLAQVLSAYSDEQAAGLLRKAVGAVRPGGRVAIPDLYLGPGKASLKETLGRIAIHLATPGGRARDLRKCQQMMTEAGLGAIQFTYLAASPMGLGMMVAEKPSH